MIKLKEITDRYKSLYACGKDLKIHPQQLQRWLDNDAYVDDKGNVFIKTKGQIDVRII